jgi:hypothetical protein
VPNFRSVRYAVSDKMKAVPGEASDTQDRSDNCLQKFGLRAWMADTIWEMQAWVGLFDIVSITEMDLRRFATCKRLREPSSGRPYA